MGFMKSSFAELIWVRMALIYQMVLSQHSILLHSRGNLRLAIQKPDSDGVRSTRAHITPDIVGVLEEHENVCPHIHLSLQSASPIILKRMKRRYSPEEAYQAIENLRRVRSDLVISADIMAGFPTESDADFELTRVALYDLEIAYPHVFVYSEREGTPAARIPKGVAVDVRTSRAKNLRLAGEEIRERVLNRYIGKQVDVLIEGFAGSASECSQVSNVQLSAGVFHGYNGRAARIQENCR